MRTNTSTRPRRFALAASLSLAFFFGTTPQSSIVRAADGGSWPTNGRDGKKAPEVPQAPSDPTAVDEILAELAALLAALFPG